MADLTALIYTRVTDKQKQGLQILAARRTWTEALIIRTAIQEYLERSADELPLSFFVDGAQRDEYMISGARKIT